MEIALLRTFRPREEARLEHGADCNPFCQEVCNRRELDQAINILRSQRKQ